MLQSYLRTAADVPHCELVLVTWNTPGAPHSAIAACILAAVLVIALNLKDLMRYPVPWTSESVKKLMRFPLTIDLLKITALPYCGILQLPIRCWVDRDLKIYSYVAEVDLNLRQIAVVDHTISREATLWQV
jgi:hypothetical protein